MSRVAPSYDPLRYGLRCLEELSRAQASVPAPTAREGLCFDPAATLRGRTREGAALTLRLFGEGPEDATGFVLRDETHKVFAPIMPRAADFFEAHVASLVYNDEAALMVGLPLVSYVEDGRARVAPLFYFSELKVSWRDAAGQPLVLPAPRLGAAVPVPASMHLRSEAPGDEGPTHSVHAGLWRQLVEVEAETLASLSTLGARSLAALVRATLGWLTGATAEGETSEPQPAGARGEGAPEAPITRAELVALGEAVMRRAHPRLAMRVYPHGVLMALPKGDPTSGLRSEIESLLKEVPRRSGPLGVYLGASPEAGLTAAMYGTYRGAPTASQRAAVAAFEASRDLVAVCGPPGCGKTTLIHHLAAHVAVDQCLGAVWRRPPQRLPWALVVSSTNNGAVDLAVAPFLPERETPMALRIGNRQTLETLTLAQLRHTLAWLDDPNKPRLDDARARFEDLARPLRDWLLVRDAARRQQLRDAQTRGALDARHAALVGRLEALATTPETTLSAAELKASVEALRAFAKAAAALVTQYANKPETHRARDRWGDAVRLRGAPLRPVLEALGLPLPFRVLTRDEPLVEAMLSQRDALDAAALKVEGVLDAALRPSLEAERDHLVAARAALDAAVPLGPPPEPVPGLFEAALQVRAAWAYEHRNALGARLRAVIAQLADDAPASPRRSSLVEALGELAGLFPLLGCTLLSTRATLSLSPEAVDRLVIDEAGQVAPIYAVAALARARRAMTTGDVAQLPPVYALDERLDARLGARFDAEAIAPFRMSTRATTSAQRLAEMRAATRASLIEHFRSQPEIVALASCFSGYSLDVRTAPRSLGTVSRRLREAVTVYDVAGASERAPEGVVNAAEAEAAVAFVDALLRDGVAPEDIAVLSPFVGQTLRLERSLHRRGLHTLPVLVRTIHKLQGGERRVVIFSVTATEGPPLRWLTERPHLLHVAASRAQDHLVVFFDAEKTASAAELDVFRVRARRPLRQPLRG